MPVARRYTPTNNFKTLSSYLQHVYAVIMAGGSGTRFWPLSRERSPKQVLSIIGSNSLLHDTAARLSGLISAKNIVVVTSRQQEDLLTPHLPKIASSNMLVEPLPRNTAPCIGLAAFHIRRLDPNAVMLVLPSDHRIRDMARFQEIVRKGVEVVRRKDALVTIGIPPTRPATGYGYIQFEPAAENHHGLVHKVKTFAEKPMLETAVRFLAAGDFYWNSGIFLWSISRILSEMEEHLPELYQQLKNIDSAVGRPEYENVLLNRYQRIRPISIDYGVMEVSHTPKYMLSGDFGWSDVGSWDELYRLMPHDADGHAVRGKAVFLDSRNTLIHSPEKLTAVIGLSDIMVINTPDATLICPLNRAQDVKLITEKLRKEGYKESL